MLDLNKIFLAALIALVVVCEGLAPNRSSVGENTVRTNATLVQLKTRQSGINDLVYTYECLVGVAIPYENLICSSADSTSWAIENDVELRVRCPQFGRASLLNYVHVTYSASSPDVNCFVHEGGPGSGVIGVTLQARRSTVFEYEANFYGY